MSFVDGKRSTAAGPLDGHDGIDSCLALAARGVHAQDPTGTIEGAVTDRTAAAIRGARVVAINLATGLTKETETAADGFYRILLLPVGKYSVTVHAPGFATLVREAIEVNVSQSVRVNAQLELRRSPKR